MDIINITCTDNGKVKEAEILARSDKYLKVVFVGTQITIEMHRQDVNKPYIGHTVGLEFTWHPKN